MTARVFKRFLIACFLTLSLIAQAEPSTPGGEGWFCEQGAENKEWICVEDESIESAAGEVLDQTSARSDTAIRDVQPLNEMLAQKQQEQELEQEQEQEQELEQERTAETQHSAPLPAKATKPPQQDPNLPEYIRLSYAPGQPINISKLPPEFYVVQIMSVKSKENLEIFFKQHKLAGLSAARVEHKDTLFYVLLLGIYESYENAKKASENMPVQLNDFKPWIRGLGSLQKAMIRADDLTGSSEY